MRRLLLLPAGLCVVLLSAGASPAQKAVTLQYKFSTKKPLPYRVTQTVGNVQTIDDQKLQNFIKQTEIFQYRLLRMEKSKGFLLERRNYQLAVDVQLDPLGTYRYDSKSDENESGSALGAALTPVYDTIKASVIKISVTPQGDLTQVKGFEELLAPIIKGKPLASQFVGGGSDVATRLRVAQEFVVLSSNPVKPGDTWKSNLNLALPRIGTAEGYREFKFAGMKTVGGRRLAMITFTTNLTANLEFSYGGMMVTGKLKSGKSSGTASFDPRTGTLVAMDETFDVGGTLTVKVNGADVKALVQQTRSSKVELLDSLPLAK